MLIASDAPKGSRAKRVRVACPLGIGQSPAFGDRHTTLFPQYLCKANLNLATGVAISVCMYSIYAIGFSLSSAKS
jgi:hypothetical protein